ncbi:MAG: metallophosphoesterase family protein [Candidatus Kapaibacterium sp.]
MNKRRFVIGDIHGCSNTFSNMLNNKLQITPDDDIYLLGDYIDRGPDSRGVVERIVELIDAGYNIYPIMGNHEQMLIDSLESEHNFWNWMMNGAKTTLASFEATKAEELAPRYLEFFRNLKYFYKTDDFIIVHGGLNFDAEDPLSDKHAMVWLRNDRVEPDKIGGRRMIVGHTPRPLEHIRRTLSENKIMLDGGCVYYGLHQGLGKLCALEINSMELFVNQNMDQPA